MNDALLAMAQLVGANLIDGQTINRGIRSIQRSLPWCNNINDPERLITLSVLWKHVDNFSFCSLIERISTLVRQKNGAGEFWLIRSRLSSKAWEVLAIHLKTAVKTEMDEEFLQLFMERNVGASLSTETARNILEFLDEEAIMRLASHFFSARDARLDPISSVFGALLLSILSKRIGLCRSEYFIYLFVDRILGYDDLVSTGYIYDVFHDVLINYQGVFDEISLKKIRHRFGELWLKDNLRLLEFIGFEKAIESLCVFHSAFAAPASLLLAIEMLKKPLAGRRSVSFMLLKIIAEILDCPKLLRGSDEQSFWAVMQHLAELKAANPDWDWLDLARPPLPPDELVATFRRLCADPPDWPASSKG